MGRNGGAVRLASRENQERLARGLGCFSIALGLAEVLAPRSVARLAGTQGSSGLIRLLGLREIISGLGILSQPRPAAWLKARVAGDALDLGLLGSALWSERSKGGRLAAATAAVAGVTVLDVLCSGELSRNPQHGSADLSGQRRAVDFKKSVTINASPEKLYATWRNFEALPRFMNHLLSVRVLDDKHSHWVAKGPAGTRVEWEAEIVEDRPNALIAWRSNGRSDVDHFGAVHFEPATGGRGTVVRVELRYRPPAGRAGATVAKLFGEAPEKQISVDLGRFKQMIETGEIARTEGQPAGRTRSTSRKYDELVRT